MHGTCTCPLSSVRMIWYLPLYRCGRPHLFTLGLNCARVSCRLVILFTRTHNSGTAGKTFRCVRSGTNVRQPCTLVTKARYMSTCCLRWRQHIMQANQHTYTTTSMRRACCVSGVMSTERALRGKLWYRIQHAKYNDRRSYLPLSLILWMFQLGTKKVRSCRWGRHCSTTQTWSVSPANSV